MLALRDRCASGRRQFQPEALIAPECSLKSANRGDPAAVASRIAFTPLFRSA